MAIQKFTLALKDFDFPLVSKMRGISVVIPTIDQEKEVPQPMWVENIMPTSRGVITVAYKEDLGAGTITALTSLPEINSPLVRKARVYSIHTPEGDSTYYCVTPIYHFLYQPATSSWQVFKNETDLVDSSLFTSVFDYKGRTFIFHPSLGFLSFTLTSGTFTEVVEPHTALIASNLRAATSVDGYIVAVDKKAIYWSSPLSGNNQGDSIEFDPSALALAGAGSTKALHVQGEILLVVSGPKGFYVYTDQSCVFAAATKNANSPWFFSSVNNSSGGFNYELITHSNNAGIHFNWTDSGLHQVQETKAQQQFPQLTEFFTGKVWEDFNALTGEIVQQLGVQIEIKIKFVSNRYLCFSYGKLGQAKQYALILDITLGRWGKLKIDHLDIFSFVPPKRQLDPSHTYANQVTAGTTYTDLLNIPFRDMAAGDYESNFQAMSVGILKPDFTTTVADFSEQSEFGTGRIIYGGISLTRSRLSQLNRVELAGVYESADVTVEIKNQDTSGNLWRQAIHEPFEDDYKIIAVGKEHQLKLDGKYQLSTIVVEVTQLGRM